MWSCEHRKFYIFFNKLSIFTITVFFLFSNIAISKTQAQNIDYYTSEEIKQLNRDISNQNDKIDSLNDQADRYQQIINQKQEEALTLENELAIIDNRLKKIELDIERKQIEIKKISLEIQEKNLQIDDKENKIEFEKVQLSGLVREMHREDQRSGIEILLLNDNLAEYFGYLKRLEEIQANMQVVLENVKDSKRSLEITKNDLELENATMLKLVLDLEVEEQKFHEEKEQKESVIIETENSEQSFQNMLSEIRFQQRVANEEIAKLQIEIKEKLRQAQLKRPGFVLNPEQLYWPIPNQGITVYYHDKSYPFRHIVGEHSGLDIRTLINGIPSMGLPIRAPAAGVVVKTISNGRYTGNAIFLSHGDTMTVYYHLSAVYVKTDDFVEIGEVIGLTGGAPGHPGAGLSSGPHLHFEVRQNGIPVDPCNYLVPGC